MAKLSLERALLSARWEIDPGYGLQQLARYVDGDIVESSTDEAAMNAIRYNSEGIQSRASDYSQETTPGSVAVISMSGAMRLESGFCTTGVQETIAEIRAADSNPNVRGILFQVNSGGGESTAGTELDNAIKDVREGGRTKIYTYFQTLGSAALRGTLHSHRTFAASNSSDVGSVGSFISLNKAMVRHIKENYEDIYAKQSTMKNGAFRAYMNGDSGPLEEDVSNHAQFFIDAVEAAKPGMKRNSEEADRLRSGDLFTGQEAASFGLIDGVATFGQVLNALLASDEDQQQVTNSLMAESNSDMSKDKKKRGILTRINDLLTSSKVSEDETLDNVGRILDEELSAEDEDDEIIVDADDQDGDDQDESSDDASTEEEESGDDADDDSSEDEDASTENSAIMDMLERMEGRFDVLAKENKSLKDKLSASDKKVAKYKSAGSTSAKDGNPIPKASSFKTVERVNGAKPGNGAKYSSETK